MIVHYDSTSNIRLGSERHVRTCCLGPASVWMVPGNVDTMGGLGTEHLKNLLVKRAKTKEKREKKN